MLLLLLLRGVCAARQIGGRLREEGGRLQRLRGGWDRVAVEQHGREGRLRLGYNKDDPVRRALERRDGLFVRDVLQILLRHQLHDNITRARHYTFRK